MTAAPDLRRSLSTQIVIGRPIEAVWNTLVDLAGYRDWNPYIYHIDGRAVAGTAITVHIRAGESESPLVNQVDVVSVSPYRMHWQGGADDRTEFLGDHFFDLVETGTFGTLLHHYEHFSGTRLNEFGPSHEVAVQRNFERFNASLKAFCEAQY